MRTSYKNLPPFLISVLFLFVLLFAALSLAQQNNALEFDNMYWAAHGDFAYLGSPNYSFPDKLTVAVWIRWTMQPDIASFVTGTEPEGQWSNYVTSDLNTTRDLGQYWLQSSQQNANFEWAVKSVSGSSPRNYLQSVTKPAFGQWVYLVGVYDGAADTSMRFYINGTQEKCALNAEINGNISAYSSPFRLNFARMPSSYRLFTSDLDEIRIYKRALSQNEIRQQMFSRATVNSTGMASYFPLDASSGTAITDQGTQSANGNFYTALVDVHSFTAAPYTITDADKTWRNNEWQNMTMKTVAGAGVDATNVVSSNTIDVLTLKNPWATTPIVGDGTNMTWFGIEDPSQTSQWVTSSAPVTNNSALILTTTPATVGVGGTLKATITSIPNTTNDIDIYQLGSADGAPVMSGESFPVGITRRSNLFWGIQKWGTVTANLVFDYSGVIGISDPADIKLLGRTRDQSTWVVITPTSRDDVNKTFTLNGQTTFYEYALGSNADNSLPVELSSLTFSVSGRDVRLNWETKTEMNSNKFVIERSVINTNSSGPVWLMVASRKAAVLSNSSKQYSFSEKWLQAGNYQYRLKMIDNDGTYKFSKTVEISIDVPSRFILSQNYPNPSTKIDYQLSADSKVRLDVYNIVGEKVAVVVNQDQPAGYYTADFGASQLSSGIYIFRLVAVDKVTGNNFSSTKKMTLLK